MSARTMIAAGIVALLLVLATWSSWQRWHRAAGQARVEQEQGAAIADSARDAVATHGEAAARERYSEATSRTNEKEIRDADGADEPVASGVRDAGLDGLCRRDAYRDSERCALRRSAAR